MQLHHPTSFSSYCEDCNFLLSQAYSLLCKSIVDNIVVGNRNYLQVFKSGVLVCGWHTWFLKNFCVRVSVCVHICVCMSTPEAISN